MAIHLCLVVNSMVFVKVFPLSDRLIFYSGNRFCNIQNLIDTFVYVAYFQHSLKFFVNGMLQSRYSHGLRFFLG